MRLVDLGQGGGHLPLAGVIAVEPYEWVVEHLRQSVWVQPLLIHAGRAIVSGMSCSAGSSQGHRCQTPAN